MRRRVEQDYGSGYAASQQEAQSRERGTRREVDRRRIAHDEALLEWEDANAEGDRGQTRRTVVSERRAAGALVEALVALRHAASLVAALPALRLSALELGASARPVVREGRMPELVPRRPGLAARPRTVRDG